MIRTLIRSAPLGVGILLFAGCFQGPLENKIHVHLHDGNKARIDGKEFESFGEVSQFFKEYRKRYVIATVVITGDDDCTMKQVCGARENVGSFRYAFEAKGELISLVDHICGGDSDFTKVVKICLLKNLFWVDEFEGETCKFGYPPEESWDVDDYGDFIKNEIQQGRLTMHKATFDNEKEFLRAIGNLEIDETVAVHILVDLTVKLESFLKVLSCTPIKKSEHILLWYTSSIP